MKQTLIIAVLSLVIFGSCKKDQAISAFNGLYMEASPIAGRSQLNFVNNKIVIKTETASSYKDTFYYSFTEAQPK
jgi:hypothetical protein